MLDTFTFKIYVPSMHKYVRFGQFYNRHYKTILKYIQNNDDSGVSSYIDWLIDHLSSEDIINNINRVDKFIIILNLYIICVESHLNITLKCESTGKDFQYKVDLVDILDKITNIDVTEKKTINIDKTFIVVLGFPTKLHYKEVDDLVVDCVHNIKTRDRSFNINKFDNKHKKRLINELPATFLTNVYEYITDKSNKFHNVPFLTIRSPFDSNVESSNYTFSLVDNTFLHFIKSIFGESLKEVYDMYYLCISKLNIEPNFLETQMTVGESMILLKKYEHELSKQVEQQNTSPATNNNDVNMPLNVPYTGLDL